MKQPEAVRQRLAVAWRRNWHSWLGGGGCWPLTVPLDPPTEAHARRHWSHFQAWLKQWDAPEWRGFVKFDRRAWPSLGPQDVAIQVAVPEAAAVASLLGPTIAHEWFVSEARWSECVSMWPDLDLQLRAIAGWIGALEESGYRRLVDAFEWLAANPDSGLYMRQLPIAGLDSKWVESHAGPLAQLLSARLGGSSGSLQQVAGLATEPSRRRLRLLDPRLRKRLGGLSDIQVRLDELVDLEVPAHVAIVIENNQTALACGDIPGAVLLMGGGFSVTELGRVPWLERIPLVYWGDIDTAGLAILNALRAWHPHTVACLMDEQTWLSHRDLWVVEPAPVHGAFEHLRPEEKALHSRLSQQQRIGDSRLEQERLAWPLAWQRLCATTRSVIAEKSLPFPYPR